MKSSSYTRNANFVASHHPQNTFTSDPNPVSWNLEQPCLDHVVWLSFLLPQSRFYFDGRDVNILFFKLCSKFEVSDVSMQQCLASHRRKSSPSFAMFPYLTSVDTVSVHVFFYL